MRLRWTLLVATLALVAPALAQDKGGARRPDMNNVRDKFSYSFGMMIGRNLAKQDIDVDPNLLIQGFKDAISGGKMMLTEQQAMEAIQVFEQQVAARQAQESKEFLVSNKKKTGVKTTPSGLQYKIVKAGKGPRPRATDTVVVNYRGCFTNGNEFDSSGGKPFTIAVNDVIDGWKEALQMMESGAYWQLFIPAELAYGEQGQPPIGPNATLVFDLELLEIAKAPVGSNNQNQRR